MKVGLLLALHDISGEHGDKLRNAIAVIESIYDGVFLTISDISSDVYSQIFAESEVNIRRIPKNGVADARRKLLEFGLEFNMDYYHYCDADRLITWVEYSCNELSEVKDRIVMTDYLIIGRTQNALLSHPTEWVKTEILTNNVFSLATGIMADITAGSCGISRSCANIIIERSKALMTDGEWATIAYQNSFRIDSVATDGLKYSQCNNGIPNDSQINGARILADRIKLSYRITDSILELLNL